MSEVKTNVMRILERQKIAYNHYCYEGTGAVSGIEVAAALGEDADRVFKTLVTVSKSRRYYVFMIPVAAELNLKKAAAAGRRKRCRNAQTKGFAALNRLCSRRLFADRHEKTVSDRRSQQRRKLCNDYLQRRKSRLSGRNLAGRFAESYRLRDGRYNNALNGCLSFNPAHNQVNGVFLLFRGKFCSPRNAVPFFKAAAAAGRRGMLGNKHRMVFHRRLVPVVCNNRGCPAVPR